MRKFTILFLLLIVVFFSNAQKTSLGITSGFGHSWLTNNDAGDVKFNPSWNAGLCFLYRINKNFGLGADIKYSTEGNKYVYKPQSIDFSPPTITQWSNFNYVRIPLKFIYFIGNKEHKIQPKLYLGPDIGLITTRSITQKIAGEKSKAGAQAYYKIGDIGFTTGAGLNFKLSKTAFLSTDVAYYNGFTNIAKLDKDIHNRNIQLNVGLYTKL
jgi:outer membrane protein W